VVIKVQFPNLASDTRGDLAAFGIISRQVALVFPQVDLAWLLPEFESNMNQEMDFDREADNIERVTAMFQPPSPTGQTGPPPGKKKDDPATDAAAAAAAATGTACGLFAGRIAVPKVYRAVSSKGVLVMEWIDGHRVNDMDAHAACGFEPEEVMDLGW
jgi:aarF domain-containing kinase